MPDWSYHVIFKPVLSRLPTYYSRELIHQGMNRISSIPGGHRIINFLGREESSPLLKREIDTIHFSNSIGLAGKVDPLLTGTQAFSNLGFGFIEIGPVTMTATSLCPPKVNKKERIIMFPLNPESIGLTQTIEKLRKLKSKQPIFIRLAGNIDDQVEMMRELDEYADGFIVESQSPSETIVPFSTFTNVPIYLAIQSDSIHLNPLNLINKMFSGIVLDESPNKDDSFNLKNHLSAIRYLRENDFSKTIITVGGVSEPDDALTLLATKVDLVMLSGGYVFTGPGLTKRIKEAQLSQIEVNQPPQEGWGWYFLFALSIFIGGLIALLISMSAVILPYDEYFLNMTREAINNFNYRIIFFMAHDRMTLAGTMISGGIVYMALAWFGVRNGLLWAKQATDAAAIIGFLGILLFIGYGYLDWLHLLFWVILTPFYILGFLKTKNLNGTPSSTNRRNHSVWKHSLLGQFAFVLLGFSFVIGGIIISYIGITNVFIPTDISYINMPPEMLTIFNERLLPVIAHDRAGFGSALLSVGLLILMVSLWGFQQGNAWIWWTLLIGGIPAFTSGIAIHFKIGYTTFIHLLPAYFALTLFIVGLVTTYHFFHMKEER